MNSDKNMEHLENNIENEKKYVVEKKLKNNIDNITYTEIFICESSSLDNLKYPDLNVNKNVKEIPINVSELFFLETLMRISKKKSPYKFFKKSFKTYAHENLVLENKENKDGPNIDVFIKNMKMYAIDFENSLVHVSYHKRKQPFHIFPSTTCLNAIMFTKRLSFLVTSHVYINFDIIYHLDKTTEKFSCDPIYKIFINLNTEKNIDIDFSRKIIDEAVKYIK